MDKDTQTLSDVSKVVDPSGGANQVRVRAYNERLVMSLVRRHQELSKADIARRSGLSAQTVSVIMRALEADGLLIRGAPVRGRVGQPSIPMRLNPEGVLSLGLKIGRRSADLVLMDFVGNVRRKAYKSYPYPKLDDILEFVRRGISDFSRHLTGQQLERICGLGVAMPGEIWSWAETVGTPFEEMQKWRDADIASLLHAASGLPVFLQNDATAACAAELVFGLGSRHADFAYFFVGMFAGGGVVLNHMLYPGKSGNAGAFGSMPIPDGSGGTRQLIEGASILVLEKMVEGAGRDASSIWNPPDEWDDFGPILDQWIEMSARNLALASLAACSVIDFEAIVIEGGFSAAIKRKLVDATRRSFEQLDLKGISRPVFEEALVGSGARASGAASLPLFARYLTDQAVLFKDMLGEQE
ncbi:ROK family transcriptional regulator [Rhizobium sp. L1K21]|nr:ROK family transcriptional regulator [Rhizobium sp. L1K21]